MRTLLLALLVSSCAYPQPRPGGPALDAGTCAVGVGPQSPEAACDGRYTADGMACVTCAVTVPCVDVSTMTYCVPACSNARCGVGKHRR